jgi:hypothetical protein
MKTRSAAAELFHATDRRTDGKRERQTEIQTEKAKQMVAFRNFARAPTNIRKSQNCYRNKRSTRIPIRTLRQVKLLQFSSNIRFDYNYTFYFSELTFNVHVRTLTTS